MGVGTAPPLQHQLRCTITPHFNSVVSVLFRRPLTFIIAVGGEELKWRQLKYKQLMSPQGAHFSPHSTAKTNDKSTNLRKNGIYWYK